MGNILVFIHIYGARAIFYYFVITKKLNPSHKKWKYVKLYKYAPINIKGSMGQLYPYFTRWEKNIVTIIHIYRAGAFFFLFYDNQDTESEPQNM